jgi:hypothetical protein
MRHARIVEAHDVDETVHLAELIERSPADPAPVSALPPADGA